MHEDLLDLLLAWSVHDPLTPPRYVSALSLNREHELIRLSTESLASRISLSSKSPTSQHASLRSFHFPRQPHLEIFPPLLLLDLPALAKLVRTSLRYPPSRFHAQSLRKFLFFHGPTLYLPQTLAHYFIRSFPTTGPVDPVIRRFLTRGGFVLFQGFTRTASNPRTEVVQSQSGGTEGCLQREGFGSSCDCEKRERIIEEYGYW